MTAHHGEEAQSKRGPMIEMKAAVMALGLELPEEVWKDVRERWNAVCAHERSLLAALQAVWDECEDFVAFEPVRDQVKRALGLREFLASDLPVSLTERGIGGRMEDDLMTNETTRITVSITLTLAPGADPAEAAAEAVSLVDLNYDTRLITSVDSHEWASVNGGADMSGLWSIFRDSERVTVAAFLSELQARRQLAIWQGREAAGGRPDVTTEGLYVARLDAADIGEPT